MRVVKQLQNQVNEIEELLQGRSTSNGHPTSKLRSKSGRHAARTGPSSSHSSAEVKHVEVNLGPLSFVLIFHDFFLFDQF